ncbi:MAG TPA: AAA family ATPase, partial [Thiotrichales bacterium]|nr:AAA family ATPase [Thiotrichales bacterium]
PQALIRESHFREDLYYRISEITVRIPPLRDRAGDVLLLARTFLERFSEQHGNKVRGFSKDALEAMEAYQWPGNVRELENRVKRAVIMAEDKLVRAEDLELGAGMMGNGETFDLREIRERAEKQAIQRALSHADGKISQAANLLGVSRPTLYDLLKKYGLKT